MSDRSKIAAASKNIVVVPLNKLKRSPKNVRQVPHTKADIQAFAASIPAIGMLQYPEPKCKRMASDRGPHHLEYARGTASANVAA